VFLVNFAAADGKNQTGQQRCGDQFGCHAQGMFLLLIFRDGIDPATIFPAAGVALPQKQTGYDIPRVNNGQIFFCDQ